MNGVAARLSSYSARERAVDPVANPLPSESELSPSVVTPTATDYTFVPPAQPEGLQRKTPPSFEGWFLAVTFPDSG